MTNLKRTCQRKVKEEKEIKQTIFNKVITTAEIALNLAKNLL
jgi:hypothetical protein